ncbi:alpha/beta hydrolase [Pectinatus sottacetonis]|uniref:alpha/beta hydrolase n=1 Tax=Pectinatus sottacetonis TaxID=1002795 RepID=UPI0018C7052D|nr:alpha/beta fold hydrolase [Pectinatus sottacetonis]
MVKINWCAAIIIAVVFVLNVSDCFAQKSTEENVQIHLARGNIYGTLEVPASERPVPVALIIVGSGPTDRNGNNNYGLTNNCLKMLADGLAQDKIATLRYDKRGIGESKFNLNESELTIEDYINDAAALVDVLKKDKRFSKVFVIGHSEGALIGSIVARKKNAAGFISLEGAGYPLQKVLLRQIKQRAPQYYDESRNILAELAQGKIVPKVDPALQALFRPSVQPYLISEMRYDPAREIGKLKMPVLLLQGTNDLQVQVADAQALYHAAPQAELVIIKGMNHILKDVPDDIKSNIESYGDPLITVDKKLLAVIKKFIK